MLGLGSRGRHKDLEAFVILNKVKVNKEVR
jgi:hypothetical protein